MPGRKYRLAAVFGLLTLSASEPFDTGAQQHKTEFNCGDDIAIPPVELKQYIKEHLQYPEQAEKASVQGRVNISFIVDTAGNMHRFSIGAGKELGYGLPEEALRVVQSIPGKWKAAKKGDLPAPCYFIVPVSFILE